MILRLLQAEAAYDGLLWPYRVRADHIMVRMNLFLLLVCTALAPWRATYAVVGVVGLPTMLLAYALARAWPGQLVTKCAGSLGVQPEVQSANGVAVLRC